MQKKVTALAKRVVAVTLACSMALAVSPMVSAKSAKKPKLNKTKATIDIDKTVKLKVVKNGFKIKSTTWKTSDKLIATVKKGTVTGTGEGTATISAKVKYTKKKWKKAKTTTLKCKVTVNYVPDSGEMDGDWQVADDPTVNEELDTLFSHAYTKPNDGATYKPIALLETQVIAGEAFRFLCRKTKPGDTKSTYSVVEVWRDFNDGCGTLEENWTNGTFDTTIEACPEEAIPGGWSKPESVKIPDIYLNALQEALGKLENFKFYPMAVVEAQGSTTSFKIICDTISLNSDPGDAPSYSLITLTVDMATLQVDPTSINVYHFSDGDQPSA